MVELARQEAKTKRLKKHIEFLVEQLGGLIEDGVEPTAVVDATDGSDGGSEVAQSDHVMEIEFPDEQPAKFAGDWREASVAELQAHGLTNAVAERLISEGIDTVGRLESRRADIGLGKEKWPKGIGPAKVTMIEDAVIGWLTKNRDSEIFSSSIAGISVAVPDELAAMLLSSGTSPAIDPPPSVAAPTESSPVVPNPIVEQMEEEILAESERDAKSEAEAMACEKKAGKRGRKKKGEQPTVESTVAKNPPAHQQGARAAEWDKMSDEDREKFLTGKIAELLAGPSIAYEGEFAQAFDDGRSSRQNDVPYTDVTWIPGAHQNAWLAGWADADMLLMPESQNAEDGDATEGPVTVVNAGGFHQETKGHSSSQQMELGMAALDEI